MCAKDDGQVTGPCGASCKRVFLRIMCRALGRSTDPAGLAELVRIYVVDRAMVRSLDLAGLSRKEHVIFTSRHPSRRSWIMLGSSKSMFPPTALATGGSRWCF